MKCRRLVKQRRFISIKQTKQLLEDDLYNRSTAKRIGYSRGDEISFTKNDLFLISPVSLELNVADMIS